MNKLLSFLNWVIRLKQEGETHDVSKSAEKFKWFSVILEFIQNAIDSNIRRNKDLKLGLLCENLLNNAYLIRPANLGSPRTFMLQLQAQF